MQHPDIGEDALPKATVIGEPTVARMSFKSFGDQSVAYRVTVPVKADQAEIEVFLDLVFIAKGRAGITMDFSAPLAPFPTEDAERYTNIVVSRTNADPKPA